jgi:hypothetical protein
MDVSPNNILKNKNNSYREVGKPAGDVEHPGYL